MHKKNRQVTCDGFTSTICVNMSLKSNVGRVHLWCVCYAKSRRLLSPSIENIDDRVRLIRANLKGAVPLLLLQS